jgi:acyl-CoA thioesterase FadM
MTDFHGGVPTFHTRVESWECDFNGHWNTRYYMRSFEAASEVLASMADKPAGDTAVRQVRFHRELVNGDAVEVRSFSTVDDEGAPAVAHCMLRDGELVATCLDIATPPPGFLPSLRQAVAGLVLPRGIVGPHKKPWKADAGIDSFVEVGPTRPGAYNHPGSISIEELMRFCAITSHTHAARIGFTLDYTRQTGIGRMLVELRLTRLGTCPVGTCLTATTRLIAAGGKSFITANQLTTHADQPIAMFELSTLAVDMKTRRATAIPDIIRMPVGA